MEVFEPLKADHPLVIDGKRCVLCHSGFVEGDRTTLLVPFYNGPGTVTVTALPVHASCVSLALVGVIQPPNEDELEDTNLSTEQKALKQRYGQAIAKTIIEEMNPNETGCCVAMINALMANAVVGLRVLNKSGVIKPEARERIVQRFRLGLEWKKDDD